MAYKLSNMIAGSSTAETFSIHTLAVTPPGPEPTYLHIGKVIDFNLIKI